MPDIFRLVGGLAILVMVVMLPASPVNALVYIWRDSAGILHYTNKEHEIPERYKARSKAIYPEAGDSAPNQRTNQSVQAKPDEQPPAPASVPQLTKPSVVQKEPASVTVPPPAKTLPANSTKKSRRHRERSAEDDD